MFGRLLSNVPLRVSNELALAMLVVVAIFLITATSITYFYYKRNKVMKGTTATPPA